MQKMSIQIVALLLLITTTVFCKPKASESKSELGETSIPFQNSKFALITSRNGLNLRSESNIKSKKLLTIPYGSMLQIVEFGKDFEVIQERNGYWLKTEFAGKKGWVFSGFVIFGKTLDGLKAYKISLEEPPSLPPPAQFKTLKPDEDTSSDFIKTKTKDQKIGKWSLIEYKYENKPEGYDCLATMSGIKFTHPGRQPTELQAREILSLNVKFPNTIPVYSNLGGCSCREEKYLSFYFQNESTLQYIDLEMPLRRSGSCGDGGGLNIETKYDRSTDTIIQETKAPNCPMFLIKDSEENERFGNGESQFAGWAYTRYVIIKDLTSGKPKLTTTQVLPSDLLKIWEASPNLTSPHDY